MTLEVRPLEHRRIWMGSPTSKMRPHLTEMFKCRKIRCWPGQSQFPRLRKQATGMEPWHPANSRKSSSQAGMIQVTSTSQERQTAKGGRSRPSCSLQNLNRSKLTTKPMSSPSSSKSSYHAPTLPKSSQPKSTHLTPWQCLQPKPSRSAKPTTPAPSPNSNTTSSSSSWS